MSSSPDLFSNPTERAYFAFDVLACHAGKLAAMGALGISPERDFSAMEFSNRLGELCGGPGAEWMFTQEKRIPFVYCQGSMRDAGLVNIGEKQTEIGMVAAVRANPDWAEMGLAVVGAVLPLAMRRNALPLHDVMSSTKRYKSGKPPLRIALYESLLQAPAEGMTPRQLAGPCSAKSSMIEATGKALSEKGIIEIDNPMDPANRLFELTDLRGRLQRQYMAPDIVTVIDLLDELQRQGTATLTGADIIDLMAQKLPDRNPYALFSTFGGWLTNRKRCHIVREVTATPRRELHFRLSEMCREQIAELLEVRRLVATDAKYRKRAASRVPRLMSQRKRLSALLAKTYRTTPGSSVVKEAWADQVADRIPAEGISAPALHGIMDRLLRRTTTYTAFRARLNRHPDIMVQIKASERGGVPVGHVLPKIYRFGSDWGKSARCHEPGVSTELFHLDDDTATPDELERAKRICRGCEVRRACLRKGLEDPRSSGIWGGTTSAERAAMPPLTRQRLLRTIIIDPPRGGSKQE